MRALESDLTAAARVRNAALRLFAERGLAGTPLREVAAAAGVTTGVVQHHFATKAGLRDAVNAYVAEIVGQAFAGAVDAEDPIADLGDRIAQIVRAQPVAVRYVGRAIIDGDNAILELFGGFVDLSSEQMRLLRSQGLLSPEVDPTWAALHPVVWGLASGVFAAAIEQRLPAPLLTDEQLSRWIEASTALFRHGVQGGE